VRPTKFHNLFLMDTVLSNVSILGICWQNRITHQKKSLLCRTDTLCVDVGQDRSVGVRSEPKLHLDLIAMPNETSFVNLSTPPRTLTLDDRPFPGIDEDRRDVNRYAGTR